MNIRSSDGVDEFRAQAQFLCDTWMIQQALDAQCSVHLGTNSGRIARVHEDIPTEVDFSGLASGRRQQRILASRVVVRNPWRLNQSLDVLMGRRWRHSWVIRASFHVGSALTPQTFDSSRRILFGAF